ncbi:MAG TPA: CDP-alcohol phosphatidyltransferase family protein [Thermoanaerobaculia bacterium]|nr:CDP-alcohol phosphatidyltransferase family protein [Thermoanaerobaculia bacterium]
MQVWRDRLHRWFAPAARRSPLSPNAITLLALGFSLVAAYLLHQRHFLLAIVFVSLGGLADAFDGIVARVQGKTSRFGDFLDHFCDRVSDVFLLSGWLIGNGVRTEIAIAGIVASVLNAYIGTQLEATFHQRTYESVGRGEFVLALVVFPIISHILFANGWETARLGGLTTAECLTLLLVAGAVAGIGQRVALARRLS